MNKHIFKGEWDLLVGKIQHQWAELTHDDLLKIKADQHKIHGILEKRYGFSAEEAQEAVQGFIFKLEKQVEIEKLKHNLSDVAHNFVEKLSQASGSYVHRGEEEILRTIKSHPVVSTGVALGLGFILGIVLARK
jgi:uncharacterized protein YjbJ (UPF0337 family)